MPKFVFSLLVSLLLASPAFAQAANAWRQCGPIGSVTAKTASIGVNDCAQYEFDEAGGTTTADSSFSILGNAASVCLDSNVAGTAGSAVVEIEACPSGVVSANTCGAATVLAAGLTCGAFTRGTYRIDVIIAVTVTEDATVTIRGY